MVPHAVSSQLHFDVIDDLYAPFGRMSRLLSSPGPLALVVPQKSEDFLDAALRLAHDLDVYHKLDAEIMDAAEATKRLSEGVLRHGHVVTIGGSQNVFTRQLLLNSETPFSLTSKGLVLRGRPIAQGSATLFLHPHPNSRSSVILVMYSDDQEGVERLLRLFPMRTGISVPDWIVSNRNADSMGAGGVEAAGYVRLDLSTYQLALIHTSSLWDNEWNWNDRMSYF